MLEVGMKGRAETTVTPENTAKTMGSGELEVFATPAMIALAERSAWTSVAGELEEGFGTVGTRMDMAHISATPVGMRVWCETELTEIDRKRLVFRVTAYDEAGKIGEGTHERFIVDNERFVTKTNGKLIML